MVGLGDGGLVWLQNDLGSVSVDVQCSQNEYQTREGLHIHTTITTALGVRGQLTV